MLGLGMSKKMYQENLQSFLNGTLTEDQKVTLKSTKRTDLFSDELHGYHHVFPFCSL